MRESASVLETLQDGLLRGSETPPEISFDLWRKTALCLLKVLLEDIAWIWHRNGTVNKTDTGLTGGINAQHCCIILAVLNQ